MKKIKITDKTFLQALAYGVYNLFKLDRERQFVLEIVHDKGNYIIPVINDKAYISCEDEEVEEVLNKLVQALLDHKVFADLKKVEIKFKAAPEHSKTVKAIVCGSGVNKHAEAEKLLEAAGYTVDIASRASTAHVKDYSELLASDPEAAAILEENRAELAKVGATFASVGLETQIAYKGAMNSENGGIIFEGPTGTGKTWNCKILSVHAKAPLKNLQITYGTTIEDLVGMFTPNDEATVSADAIAEIHVANTLCTSGKISMEEYDAKVREVITKNGGNSKWKFVPGPLLIAYWRGWQIYLDEINYGQAGIISCINQFTDGTSRVIINGKTYHRHPNFVIYMTMNPGYEGTDPLNVALKNRFAKVNVPALSKEEFARRMMGYSKGLGHGLSGEFFAKLYDFAENMEKLGNSTEYHENVKFSIRNAQRLCDIILSKSSTIEEFRATIYIQYINDLTTDNDNSDKVERLKADKSILNQIQELYELYDFAEIPVASKTGSLDDIFITVEESETLSDADDELVKDEDLDKLLEDL